MLSWARHCILKVPTDEEQLMMEPEELLTYWRNYHDVIRRAEDDPYRHGFVLENWRRMKSCFDSANEVLALGGNRCLAGEQEIYDPVQKKKLRVDKITVMPTMRSLSSLLLPRRKSRFKSPVNRYSN